MTEFELLAIPLSLILGLGITNILSDVSDAIRDRERVPLHWLPFSWAFLIFFFQVQYFFVLWDFHETGMAWTWPNFGPALFNCVILYLSAGLILPGRRNSDSASLLADFQKHGHLSLITLAIMLLVAILLNFYYWERLVSIANLLNVVLILSICPVLFSKKLPLQLVGTLLFAITQFYGTVFIWSVPGWTAT